MPAAKTIYRYQPFLRACVRFTLIGTVAYVLSLFVDGAFTMRELTRATTVVGLSGLFLYHWRHLLTRRVHLTERQLEWQSPTGARHTLAFTALRQAVIRKDFAVFADSKYVLELTGPEAHVELCISHLEGTSDFLDTLESHLSRYDVSLCGDDPDGRMAGTLDEGY